MIVDLFNKYIRENSKTKKEKVYISYESFNRSETSSKTISELINSNKFDIYLVGDISDEDGTRLRDLLGVKISSRKDYDGLYIGDNVIPFSNDLTVKTVESKLSGNITNFWNRLLPEVFGSKNLDRGNISDGYHTFNELYDQRATLLLLSVNMLDKLFNKMRIVSEASNVRLLKARKHNDGTFYEGMFLLMAQYELDGEIRQFSFHLEDKYWDDAYVQSYSTSPIKYDGHTVKDAMINVDILNKTIY